MIVILLCLELRMMIWLIGICTLDFVFNVDKNSRTCKINEKEKTWFLYANDFAICLHIGLFLHLL